jgi:OOP family OmpA-OmpF porin
MRDSAAPGQHRTTRGAVLLCALAWVSSAGALEGFALNRFDPAERGSAWFAAESLHFAGHNRWAVGFVGDVAQGPLVAREAADGARVTLIDSQSFVHAGASVVLNERLRLGFGAPLLAYQRASAFEAPGVSVAPREGAALGDVRLGADVRVFGAPADTFRAGAGVRVYLPTGEREAFASDGAVRVAPQLEVAGELGHFVYASSIGVQIRRGAGEFSGASGGSELGLVAAAGVRLLERRLVLGPELWGSTVIGGGDAFMKRRATPFEVVVGGHYDVFEDLRVALGVGPGLSEGLGSPALRGLASIEWAPRTSTVSDTRAPSPGASPAASGGADGDGDGVLDADDRCPERFGMASNDPSSRGCPPWESPRPSDSDGDGISDAQDACAGEPGMANPFDSGQHGCPQRAPAPTAPAAAPEPAVELPAPAETLEALP